MGTAARSPGGPQAGVVLSEVVRFTADNAITALGGWGSAGLPVALVPAY